MKLRVVLQRLFGRILILPVFYAYSVAAQEHSGSVIQESKLVSQYIDSRDALLRKFKQEDGRESEDDVYEQELLGLRGLEKKLRKIIGPLHIKGYEGEGEISLSALSWTPYGDSKRLDGLILE
ncbi:MAG: hypothetical protein Q9M20_04730, partial [Mariprofundaceae bacterium]|nr:hypothetical protein [Mariprofundaceae bacterium]